MATPIPSLTSNSEEAQVLSADSPVEQAINEVTPVEVPVVTEATKHEELLRGVDDVLKKSADATPVTKTDDTVVTKADEVVTPTGDQPVAKVDDKPSIDPSLLTDVDKEDDKLEFKDHPRFVALRQEALQSRASARAFEAQVQPLRESAEKLSAISGFVNGNGISEDEFVEGLEIMAALKNDPLKAAKLLAPHISHLGKFTGEGELPKELQDRVSDGELSEAAAREIVRARTEASIAQTQAHRVTSAQQQEIAQRNLVEAGHAVSAWEANISRTDVDYAKKQPLVIRLIQAEAALRPPRNPTEAIALAQRCYTDISKNFVTQVTKTATKPTPSTVNGSQARNPVLPKPKSLLDGVGQVLAGIRG
jgi:hypothetical protein